MFKGLSFRNGGLKTKLVLGGCLMAIVPIIILGALSFYFAKQAIEKEAYDQSTMVSKSIADMVDGVLTSESHAIAMLAQREAVIQAVKDKVKEKGLMTEAELASLSQKEAMNLVFIPGLSTAQKLSSVSGRGVGMDVVKTNIEKMNGQAYIDSEEGKWTKLTIKLPLTLAIMRALIVKVREELFAIPLNTVTELVKLREGLIKTVDKNEVLVLRNTVIPIVDLRKAFLFKGEEDNSGYIVICNIGDKIIGIKVHSVIGQEEVVIKPLGEFLKDIKGISGATIRGDGKVILILDIPSVIINYANHKKLHLQAQPQIQAGAMN